MKGSKRSVLLATAIIIAVIGLTAIVLALGNSNSSNTASNSYDHNENEEESHQVVDCKTTGKNLTINISGDKMNPANIEGTLCDTLTITNSDTKTRLIAFGHHNSHKAYDGVTEKVLKQGQSLTVNLNEKGSYTVHDHYQDEVEGSFKVN